MSIYDRIYSARIAPASDTWREAIYLGAEVVDGGRRWTESFAHDAFLRSDEPTPVVLSHEDHRVVGHVVVRIAHNGWHIADFRLDIPSRAARSRSTSSASAHPSASASTRSSTTDSSPRMASSGTRVPGSTSSRSSPRMRSPPSAARRSPRSTNSSQPLGPHARREHEPTLTAAARSSTVGRSSADPAARCSASGDAQAARGHRHIRTAYRS